MIIGASGHAKVVIDAATSQQHFEVIGLLDEQKQIGEQHFGKPILGRQSNIAEIMKEHQVELAFVAIGDNAIRAKVVDQLEEAVPELRFAVIVHAKAIVAKQSEISPGTLVLAGAVVNANAHIGKHCIVNTLASVEHDVMMADYVSLAPGAITGGNAVIRAFSAIGLGANILHGVTVAEECVIGAGATVIHDIPANSVALGLPAKVIRTRVHGDRYL